MKGTLLYPAIIVPSNPNVSTQSGDSRNSKSGKMPDFQNMKSDNDRNSEEEKIETPARRKHTATPMEVYSDVCFKNDGEAERAMQNEYGSPILGLGMAYFMTGHRVPICRIFSLDARNISARKSGSIRTPHSKS